jgi:Tfp pilus assembly protein FimT
MDVTKGQRGFTSSELLVVIALMALVVLFGGPALAEAYRSYKVRAAANNLTIDLQALRYNAVTNRVTRTMTLNDQTHGTAPNQYSFLNAKGDTVAVQLVTGVNLESSSPASLSFDNNGATGVTSSQTVNVSMDVSGDRGDRYAITVTPTGTVSTTYSTYTP